MEVFIRGNSKMGSNVPVFNIPVSTCKPTAWCLHGRDGKPACYGRRNNFLLPPAQNSAYLRYEITKRDDFVDKAADALRRMAEWRRKHDENFENLLVRWHAIGDIYSEEYGRKLINIAKNVEDLPIIIRTTTRREDMKDLAQELHYDHDNFIIRQSLDTVIREPTMGLPVAALIELDYAQKSLMEGKAIMCAENCVDCGYRCWLSDSLDNVFLQF